MAWLLAPLGSRRPFLSLSPVGVLLAIGLLSLPAHAAESIAAHLDANGRMVFVNEDPSVLPAASASKKSTASKTSATGRRVIATSEQDKKAEDKIAATSSAEPSTPKETSASQDQAAPEAASATSIQSQGDNAPAAATDLDAMIEQAAAKHQIDPELVKAIVRVESNYNPRAVSPAGALGLMQLIPATAMRFGVANPFDPQANLDGGIRYLKYLLGQYGGNLQLSLAAYNAGEDAVARNGGTIPAYRETQDYIRKIAQLYPQQAMPGGLPPVPTIVKFMDSTGVVHFSNTDF